MSKRTKRLEAKYSKSFHNSFENKKKMNEIDRSIEEDMKLAAKVNKIVENRNLVNFINKIIESVK